jgi:hypothetical protein
MVGFFLCLKKRVSSSIRRGGLKGEQKADKKWSAFFVCLKKRVSSSIRRGGLKGEQKADKKWSAFFVCLKKGFQVQSAAAD